MGTGISPRGSWLCRQHQGDPRGSGWWCLSVLGQAVAADKDPDNKGEEKSHLTETAMSGRPWLSEAWGDFLGMHRCLQTQLLTGRIIKPAARSLKCPTPCCKQYSSSKIKKPQKYTSVAKEQELETAGNNSTTKKLYLIFCYLYSKKTACFHLHLYLPP